MIPHHSCEPVGTFRFPEVVGYDAMTTYWAACDVKSCALDPADLGAPEGLLDDAHDAADLVESLAADRGISRAEARELV